LAAWHSDFLLPNIILFQSMVTLLFVLVALGSLANSAEVRDHDNQHYKVSASSGSSRRVLTAASEVRDHDNQHHKVSASSGSSRRLLMAASGFVGEEGMLPAGFRPNGFGFDEAEDANVDAFDRLNFVGEEGMLPAGFSPIGFGFEEADDVNVDGFDDFGNRNSIRDGGDPEEDFIAAEDPMFGFGFLGMHYDCAWTVGDGIGGSEEKISETLTERECMLACRSDGRFNGATVNSNGQGGCWCEAGMTDVDSSATTFETCRFDVDWILLRSDVECGNNENEVNLGTFADVDACAEACRNRDGCTNFIYGKGEKAGKCWDEAITESACTIWEDDQYDFYKLPGTETNLPAF